jgi:hypothetical protein
MDTTALSKIQNRILLISWPPFGCGNSLMRVISHHSPYYYNPNWNPWGSDRGPLDPPSDDGAMETWFCGSTPIMKTVVHLGSCNLLHNNWLDDGDFWTIVAQNAQKNKRDFIEWSRSKKTLILPIFHLTAAESIGHVPDVPFIQLYTRTLDTINNRWPKKRLINPKYANAWLEENCVQSPNICNICIEDFFFSDYNTFKLEFDKLSEFCKFETPDVERTRQWVLYYRDRIERYLDQDKEAWAKGEQNVKTTKR